MNTNKSKRTKHIKKWKEEFLLKKIKEDFNQVYDSSGWWRRQRREAIKEIIIGLGFCIWGFTTGVLTGIHILNVVFSLIGGMKIYLGWNGLQEVKKHI